MRQQAAGTLGIEKKWFFMRFGLWVRSKFNGLVDWFSLKKEVFSADESGALMQRYMARKSWFDKISSGWVEQSFLIKSACIAGFILVSALIGLLVSASLLFALSAILVSFIAHILFISHERNRREGATIFAEEAMALNEELRESQQFFKRATSGLYSAADELQHQGVEMEEQAAVLDVESKRAKKANDELIVMVEEVAIGIDSLLTQEAAVTHGVEAISNDLKKCDQAIITSTARVEALDDALSLLSETTQDLQQSQKMFSSAVDHFSLFVRKQSLTKAADIEADPDPDEFIESLKRQNDEDEALIAEMKLMMAY